LGANAGKTSLTKQVGTALSKISRRSLLVAVDQKHVATFIVEEQDTSYIAGEGGLADTAFYVSDS
jgi:hypothetical protein